MHIIEVQRFLRIVLFLSLHHCGPFGRPCKDGKMPMREVIWKSAISEHVWAEMPPNPLTGDVGAGPWQGTGATGA